MLRLPSRVRESVLLKDGHVEWWYSSFKYIASPTPTPSLFGVSNSSLKQPSRLGKWFIALLRRFNFCFSHSANFSFSLCEYVY